MPATLGSAPVWTATLLGGGAIGVVSAVSSFSLGHRRHRPGSSSPASISELAALEPIDTHSHAYQAVPGLADLLTRLHLRILNVLLIDGRDPFAKAIEPQWTDALAVRRLTKGRAAALHHDRSLRFREPQDSLRG